MITADDGRYYSKPLLSTALTQKKTSETLLSATVDQMVVQLSVEIKTHCIVQAVHIEKNDIVTDKGETIHYEKLIFACGAEVISPRIQGDGAKDILSINHIYHYTDFQQRIQNKKQIAILGAGLIGCEFANDLSNAGYQVHVVSLAKTPLDLLLPEKIGVLLQDALEKNGVSFHFNCTAERVEKTEAGYRLFLSNQQLIDIEFILSAIGLKPHISLAKIAGIDVNQGIVVNRYLETSVKNIYAIGDCAEVEGHVLPYIAPILQCARALAKTLTGIRTAVDYPAMPIVVKTPAHPIVICPPPKTVRGEWKIEKNGMSVRALFYAEENQALRGFVLTNEAVKERLALVKQIPGLF